ncbi:hypothetical protein [Pseudomonas sp.]|jgi:hypothetical protein|uniref:hypothetical protein n=1 Tax=Pseudomonas sp. TaxID=306 RepID=UPI00326383EE
MPPPNDPLAAGNTSDAGVLLDLPRVQGVDPADSAGTLPDDAKQNGIVCIIPRWPAFPTDARIDHVEIFIVGNPIPIAQRDYGAADDAAEFPIPIGPTLLPDLPTFEIMYTVRSVNITTSPPRRLTYAPPKVLKEPTFPDASLWGYINCTKNNPQDPDSLYVWEGIRILVPYDNRFQLLDDIELVWQGWDSLNGAGTALTPAFTFTGTVTDVTNKQSVSIVIRPFVPHIEPMRDKHSATARYLLLRNGVPIFSSFTGLVKIDRVIPGESGFCSDASWMK